MVSHEFRHQRLLQMFGLALLPHTLVRPYNPLPTGICTQRMLLGIVQTGTLQRKERQCSYLREGVHFEFGATQK